MGKALRDWGWLVALVIALTLLATRVSFPGTREVTGTDKTVKELEVEPSLLTALDICQDSASEWPLEGLTVKGFQVAHYAFDDHYEGQLVQNPGQLNAVRYRLFWRPNLLLDVIIEESRAGEALLSRTEPHTKEFDACVRDKKIREVSPVR